MVAPHAGASHTTSRMTSDPEAVRRGHSEDPQEAPTELLAGGRHEREGSPPGVAPDQAPDGAPPTAEEAPSLVTPQTASAAGEPAATADAEPPPRLAAGIELVGRYEDSGFKEAPYIARRSDGQMVQMPPMLYALAEVIDGKARETELARRFSERIERQVEPEMVRTLLDEQLRPLGVVAEPDGSSPKIDKIDPLLALKFRTKVVPQPVVHALTTVFKPLFWPPVVIVVVLAFIALDVWLFGLHGVSQSLRRVIYEPTLLFMLFGGVVLGTAFHEIGHATGTRYGGAKPGVMGVGVYIVWPAFYTDITDAYRLGKGGRLRADMGGMYFNAVFALAVGALYAVSDFEPLLLLIVLQTFAIVQQSLPLLRLDGFYIISDLTGVPDMLTRLGAVLRSLLPGRDSDPRVTELKPWVRRVVTGYVCTVVPLITLLFAVMLVHAPRAFATGYDSLAVNYQGIGAALSGGRAGDGILSLLRIFVLLLPLAGLTYTTGRIAKRAGTGAWSWSADHPVRRGGLALGTGAAVALTAFLWWPDQDYRPIQPVERGTLVSAVRSLPKVPTGRAPLPPQRARELGGAPFEYQTRTPTRGTTTPPDEDSSTTTQTTTAPATTMPQTTTSPATTTEPVPTTTAPAGSEPTATAPVPSEPTTTTPGTTDTTTTEGTTTTP